MNKEAIVVITITVFGASAMLVIGSFISDYVMPHIPFIRKFIDDLSRPVDENGFLVDKTKEKAKH